MPVKHKIMDAPLPEGLNDHWRKLLANDSGRKRGQDIYPCIFEDSILFPLQRRNEMSKMMREARSIEPRVVYEIGADKGGGLYHWCKCLPTVQRVIACEIRGTPYARLFESAFPDIEFMWIQASSYDEESVSAVKQWLGPNKIDCVFIDGDKCAFDKDFWAYYPLVRNDGIVFMHDIQDEAPRSGFDSVAARGFKYELYVNIEESHEAADREAKGVPPASPHEQWLRHWKGRSAGVGIIHV